MTIFFLLSKLSLRSPNEVRGLGALDREFEKRLEKECPEVERVASYALLGEYDFLHIFEAPDARSATKVALLANVFGNCSTQTLTAISFDEFRALLDEV